MKERMRRILCCMGTAGVMTVMMAVPAMAADVTEDDQNLSLIHISNLSLRGLWRSGI